MPAEPKTYKRKSTQFKPLTAMQEAYCQSYIKTPENQTQAAINAGFSPNTAAVKASVMMRDERIQKRIAELMEERNKRMRVSGEHVHVNAFKERLDVNVNVTIADRIAAARKRLKERQDGNQ
ncbi:terminase small subunit [Escherichia marmotae]|nr:terminase small subunit [Escherichia marmotae]